MIISNMKKIIPTHKNEDPEYEYYKYDITKHKQQSSCSVLIYSIPPGKSGYPFHYHMKNEEVFYIISGQGVLRTSSSNENVSSGDVIVCDNSESGSHKLTNSSETEPLVYIEFDTINFPEVIYYPDSNKMGIFINDENKKFYREGDDIGYYE